jgi:hypothetical protein
MAKRRPKSKPTWADVKAKLEGFDRPALLSLVQNLYAAHMDNQAFLHARFGLGENVREPYKKTIDRWLWPDVFRGQDTSVSKAKQAISDYKKALGDPDGPEPDSPPVAIQPKPSRLMSREMSSNRGSTETKRSAAGIPHSVSILFRVCRQPVLVPSQTFGYPIPQSGGRCDAILSGRLVSTNQTSDGVSWMIFQASARHSSARALKKSLILHVNTR